MKNQKYVKKPIPIDAIKLDEVFPHKDPNEGSLDPDLIVTGIEWVDTAVKDGIVYRNPFYSNIINVKTLEGIMDGSINDYLIHGVRGELYICEKSIFEETYEPVD